MSSKQSVDAAGHAPAAGGETSSVPPPLRIERPQPGIAVLTLDRPASRNSLSLSMLEALQQALDGIGRDAGVNAVVLAAAGPVFCAGHDLKELRAHRADGDGGRAFYAQAMSACSRMMQSVMACPKPVIAAVEGTATAAGCQLVASCDLAVAGKSALFCTPGVNIGLFCSTPMVALSRNVPRKRAMEMLLTGDMIDATTAAAWGLVNRVVADGAALDGALGFARQIASKSPLTVAVGKRAFYEQIDMSVADAYAHTARVMVDNLMARDAQEGIGAFLDKRPPEWSGC